MTRIQRQRWDKPAGRKGCGSRGREGDVIKCIHASLEINRNHWLG